jgi:hypothetical protein
MINQYRFIINPLTGRKVKSNGNIGKDIIKNYLNHIMMGGADVTNAVEKKTLADGTPSITNNFIFVIEYGGSGTRLHIFKVDYLLSSFESITGSSGELEISIEKKVGNITKSTKLMRNADVSGIVGREIESINKRYSINKIYVLCFVSGGHISLWGNPGRDNICSYPFIEGNINSNLNLDNNRWFKLYNKKTKFVSNCAPRYIKEHLLATQLLISSENIVVDQEIYVDEGIYETNSVLNNFFKTKEGKTEKSKWAAFLVLLCGSTTIQISISKRNRNNINVLKNYTFDYQRSPENPQIYKKIINDLIKRANVTVDQIKVLFCSNYGWVLPKCGKRYRELPGRKDCSKYFISNLGIEISGWNNIEINEELIERNCRGNELYYTRQSGRPSESMVMALKVLKNLKFSKFTVFKDLYYWDPNAINITDKYAQDNEGIGEWKLMSIGPHHGVILSNKAKIQKHLFNKFN